MFSDINNISLIEVNTDADVHEFLRRNPGNLAYLCFSTILTKTFDEMFYNMAGLNFDDRWNKFFIPRDRFKENELIDKFNVRNKEYVFVHDDPSRGFTIDNKYLENKLIVRPDKAITPNACDYISLIENAKEVHCINSSFRILVDHLTTTGSLYFHLYPRRTTDSDIPYTKKNWITL